jgi:imidazolonepropionase-like amidohydrolase
MKRVILAGVRTIEHGDYAGRDTYRLMREHGVALCPTLAVGDAIAQYGGWVKGADPDPPRIVAKKESFRLALDAGIRICFGGDVGPFPHGENVRELELMVEYGMDARDALRAATSTNADLFGLSAETGRVRKGLAADLIAVDGDPSGDISALRNPRFVMQAGKIIKLHEHR